MYKVVTRILALLLTVSLLPVMAAPAAEAASPVTIANPGFESGLTSWQQLWPDNPAQVVSTTVHSGTNSLLLDDTKADGYFGVNSAPVPAVAGELYKVTVNAYYETNAYGVLVIAFDNSQGQSIKDNRVGVAGGAGKWSEMTVSLQAPANTASVRVRLITGLTQTGKVYFDDVKLEKLTTLKGTVTQQGAGTPVPSVKLSLYRATDTAFANAIASATSGEDGSYALSNMDPGAYVIRAVRTGFVTQVVQVQVAEGSNAPLNIQLSQDPASVPRSISGTVTELAHGGPLQGAKVSLYKETDHTASAAVATSVTTGADGRYAFPAVALPDRYFVTVEKSGYVTTREPVYVYDEAVLDADVQVPAEPTVYTTASMPKPSGGHPRLFVRSEDIPGILAKQSLPFFQPLFANLEEQRNTQGYTSRSSLTATENEMQTFAFPAAEEARYVRLVSRGSTGSNTLAIRELEVFKEGSGGGREEVPIQGATSSAVCSNSSEFAPEKAIDKDVNTLYCNFDLMGTITFDLGTAASVQSLDIIFNYDTSRVYLFDILVSADNANWRLVDLGMGGGALPPAPAGQSNIILSLLSQVNANAFAYMLDPEQSVAQGQNAVDTAIAIVDTVQYKAYDYNNKTGQLLEMVSLVYDWCYPLLTNEQKVHFKDAILRFAGDMEMRYYDTGPKVFEYALGTGHGAEDQLFRYLLGAAVAIYDEYPNVYNRVVPEFLNKAVPVRDYFYGSDSHHQGEAYGSTRYSTELWATTIFTRMGLPSPFSIAQSKVIYKQMYTRRPDGQIMRDGDEFNSVYTPLNAVWRTQPLAMLAASLFDDPYIKNEFMETYVPNEMPIYEILLLDGNTAAEAEPPNTLPLTHYFNDPEASMVARTGWDDVSTTTHQSPSVIAEMKIGNRRFGNHEHMDFGSFQIYYKGGLAIDSGIYSGKTPDGSVSDYFGPHDQYYNKRTIAHNSMLVYDPSEGTVGNDGGQRWRDTGPAHNGTDAQTLQDVFGSNYKFGEVQGHAFGPDPIAPDYSYIKGDLTSAYTAKMEQYQRSMMFLNLKDSTNPAAMIVFDRVVSSDPNFKKYWLLHSMEEPVIDEATKTATIKRTEHGDSGKLVNQTLLPAASNAVIEKVGGPGHEFDVFGTNYPVVPSNPSNTEEPGAWRIQLSPGTPAKEDLFLNVMQVMDGDKQPLPVQKLDAPALVGVQLADKAVLFSKTGKRLSGSVAFAVYAGANDTQFIVTDLAPGKWKIKHDGETRFGTVTKEGNVLSFNGAAGTTYTLTSVTDDSAPADAIFTANVTEPTNADVLVTIDYPAEAEIKEYKLGASGIWTAYTAPIVVTGNDTVYARGTSAGGNASDVTGYTVSNIDKTAPVTTGTLSPASPDGNDGRYASSVTVSLTASDNASGVAKTEYRVNDGPWVIDTGSIPPYGEGSYDFEYRSIDRAENVESLKSLHFQVAAAARITSTLTGTSSVLAGQPFDVTYGLSSVTQAAYAQEQTFYYDAAKVEFLSAAPLRSGLSILAQTVTPGQVRIITASTGAGNEVSGTTPLLVLHFKAKTAVQPGLSVISASNVIVADENGIETALSDETVYSVQVMTIAGDVNGDGKVSIGDLAMAAAYYGKTSADANWSVYRLADLDGDGKIDIVDLAAVARNM
ncbi:heparin/heparin-sulfate lyase HepB [Cohnella sp. GCM10012308]|uniref:heparin/heparin-sulfate lyase HepB n=1 Tax=Cohnella sp. GCM10012308 TaxID=3317329 RepID=UPI003623BC49